MMKDYYDITPDMLTPEMKKLLDKRIEVTNSISAGICVALPHMMEAALRVNGEQPTVGHVMMILRCIGIYCFHKISEEAVAAGDTVATLRANKQMMQAMGEWVQAQIESWTADGGAMDKLAVKLAEEQAPKPEARQ